MGNMAVKLFLVFANIVATLQSYDIELRGGYDNPCHDGHWEHYCAGNVYARNNLDVMGPVSDLFWGPEEATVVCHQLGYNYGSPICGSRFGTENNFAMGEVSCSGQESRIQDCSYKTDTWQGKAAGAECFDDPGLYGTTFAPECDSATTDHGTNWPGTTDGTNWPGTTGGTNWPGTTDGTTWSGTTDGTTWPGTTDGTNWPGTTDGTNWPGTTDGTTWPGTTDGTNWPGTTEGPNEVCPSGWFNSE